MASDQAVCRKGRNDVSLLKASHDIWLYKIPFFSQNQQCYDLCKQHASFLG